MTLLRKHQERIVSQFLDNINLSVSEVLDKGTNRVNRDECIQTKIIAPWCRNAGKSAVLDHIALKAIREQLRVLMYCANDDHMRKHYLDIRTQLVGAWDLKAESENVHLTSDKGGICYFASNRMNNDIIHKMRPYIHVLLVDEGDFVSTAAVKDILEIVPTAVIIGTRHGSANGLLANLIDYSIPKDGVTINEINEDDLIAEGYPASVHDTVRIIQEQDEKLLAEADALSTNKDNVATSAIQQKPTSTVGHDTSGETTNKTFIPDPQ